MGTISRPIRGPRPHTSGPSRSIFREKDRETPKSPGRAKKKKEDEEVFTALVHVTWTFLLFPLCLLFIVGCLVHVVVPFPVSFPQEEMH